MLLNITLTEHVALLLKSANDAHIRVLNDTSLDGDMMHLLRKYDVARFTRNDAMFAIKCGKGTHH